MSKRSKTNQLFTVRDHLLKARKSMSSSLLEGIKLGENQAELNAERSIRESCAIILGKLDACREWNHNEGAV